MLNGWKHCRNAAIFCPKILCPKNVVVCVPTVFPNNHSYKLDLAVVLNPGLNVLTDCCVNCKSINAVKICAPLNLRESEQQLCLNLNCAALGTFCCTEILEALYVHELKNAYFSKIKFKFLFLTNFD